MELLTEDLLKVPIQLADSLLKSAAEPASFRQECAELQRKAQLLGSLLRKVARVSSDGSGALYKRPMRRIMEDMVKALDKALLLVKKCKRNCLINRMMFITSGSDFKRVYEALENAIGNTTWLLSVATSGDGKSNYLGMPNIAMMNPMLSHVWEHIALLQRGTDEDRADAATVLASMAKDNDRNAKLIVEEEGIPPMLKLLMEGNHVAQEAAARALGYMARDEDNIKQMVLDGVVPVFVNVLRHAPMKVQARVAWALSEIVSKDSTVQDLFLQDRAIMPLVSLLAFETLEEPSNMNKAVNMVALVASSMAATKGGDSSSSMQGKKTITATTDQGINKQDKLARPQINQLRAGNPDGKAGNTEAGTSRSGGKQPGIVTRESGKGLIQNRADREKENPQLKEELKTEVARALWKLAKGNRKTSKSITETRALLCLAKLIEKGKGALQWNSVMAIMEIAAVAEEDPDLRRSAFKTNSPAAKAVVQQLLRLVEEGDPDIQAACIKAIGCLSRSFTTSENRVIKPLVKQLEGREDVATEAVVALEKFTCRDNYLHMDRSRSIIDAGGALSIVHLIYFGNGRAQISAVSLMCYLALDVRESEALAKAEALRTLEWVSKHSTLMQDSSVQKLLRTAIGHLEIYQGKGVRH